MENYRKIESGNMATKFQPPKGTRDFMPEDMARREYVFSTIKRVFESFGFRPMETPAFESWELLGAKGGGGEAIRNEAYVFKDKGGREMGLRFDLTVPTARVVASNPQLPRPFKRLQIGRVWRYDNPQAGRFREFWQADIDTFGVTGMEADAEIIAAAVEALNFLGFGDFKVRLNDRKLLNGIVESAGIKEESAPAVFRALDKLEKQGEKAVEGELSGAGLGIAAIGKLMKSITTKGKPEEVLASAKKKFKCKSAEDGIRELEQILELCKSYGVAQFVEIDFSLVRGLDYYTGPIFEISAAGSLGSMAGGGRYDKLIGMLSGRDEPAVGISLGVERVCELMNQKGMFKDVPSIKTKVFVAAAGDGDELRKAVIETAQKLRSEGVPAETDLMGRKLKQCFEYAEKAGIPYMIIIGEKELASGKLTLRNMARREQAELGMDGVLEMLRL